MGFVWVTKISKKKARRPKVTATDRRLEALGKRMGSAVQLNLVNGLRTFKRRIPKDVLIDAFKSGDYMAALRLVDWKELPTDLAGVFEAIGLTVDEAGQIQIKTLPPNVNKNLRFDTANPRIKSYLAKRTGALITAIEDDARANVREIITSSFRQAQTPRQLAERVKASVGILPAHERALFNYRTGLEADGRPAKEVDRLADAYEERLLDYRAMNIARSETQQAMHTGQLSVWKEGAAQGLIDLETAKKVWATDGNPCETCEPMDGEMVGLDEDWIVEYPNGETKSVQIPSESHPSCMCSMTLHFGEQEETPE